MHSVFGVATEMTNPELYKEIEDLKEKYIKIEYDPTMSIEEKIPREFLFTITISKYKPN